MSQLHCDLISCYVAMFPNMVSNCLRLTHWGLDHASKDTLLSLVGCLNGTQLWNPGFANIALQCIGQQRRWTSYSHWAMAQAHGSTFILHTQARSSLILSLVSHKKESTQLALESSTARSSNGQLQASHHSITPQMILDDGQINAPSTSLSPGVPSIRPDL